jgi:anti-sigma B factor antagonist
MPDPFVMEEVEALPRSVTIRLSGRLDAKSAPELTRRCSEHRTQARSVILNLAGVTFIASSGVGALLSLEEEFRQAGAKIRFACLSPAVVSVVRLLNLEQFLAIRSTEEEARRGLD